MQKEIFYNSHGYNSNGKVNVIIEFQNKEDQNLAFQCRKEKLELISRMVNQLNLLAKIKLIIHQK